MRLMEARAEDGTRTRDPNLGKVMLYQLSYFRIKSFVLEAGISTIKCHKITNNIKQMNITKLQQKSVLQKLQNVAQNRNKVAQKSHKSFLCDHDFVSLLYDLKQHYGKD